MMKEARRIDALGVVKLGVGLCVVLMLGGSATAAVTYVDAVAGTNTFNAGSTSDASAIAAADGGADGVWWDRAGFGTNGNVLTASGNGGAEDAAELNTIISGLTAGSYNIWAFFYDVTPDDNQNWGIRAGLSAGGGANPIYADSDAAGSANNPLAGATTASLASTLTYVSAPKFDDGGGRLLFAASLGTAVADGSGDIAVFIDDLNTGVTSNNRSWYDGVGYEFVPEPSSVILAGMVLVGVAAFRRRNR